MRAGARWDRLVLGSNEADQRNQLCGRGCGRRAGRVYGRPESGGAYAKIILSARSGEYERLHNRRKRRDERGWSALSEIRRNAKLCDRSRSGARQRPSAANWWPCSQEQNRVRFDRSLCRLGRNARRGHGDHVAPASAPTSPRYFISRICHGSASR